jgi:methyl-accepting chemotaxis protein
MSRTETLRRWLEQSLTGRPRANPLEGALLHGEHEKAKRASETALTIARSLGTVAAHQRSALDAAADEARLLGARGSELRSSAERVRECLERTKLVALNAGLEGARLGESVGRAVIGMAEEVRTLAARGLEALGEHAESLDYVVRGRDRLQEQLDQVRQRASLAAEELLRAEAAQTEVGAAIAALGQRIEAATGTDSQTAQAMAAASSHARGLLDALSTLSTKSERGLTLRALGPTLGPLLRLLESARRPRGEGV